MATQNTCTTNSTQITYENKLRLNIKISYINAFFLSMWFILPIWYDFETQFVSPVILGTIYALTHLITVLLELPTGALADLIGRRKTIIIGRALQGMSWILISQSKDIGWLWGGYSLNAIGVALTSGADTALDYDSLKELGKEKEFSKFSSTRRLIHRVATVIAVFSGGYIFKYNQKLPYILVGMSMLIGTLFTFLTTEPEIDTEKFSLQSYLKQTKQGFQELYKNEYIRNFSIYYTIVGGITWYFIYFLNQPFATEIGFTALERSWLFAGIYIIGEIILFGLIFSKVLSRKTTYIMFPVIMILGFIPGYWVPKSLAIICIFLLQMISSARFSILNQYSNMEFDSKYRATAISALNMTVSIVFILISIGAGLIIENYGAGSIMTLLGILTTILVLPLTYILVVRDNDEQSNKLAK